MGLQETEERERHLKLKTKMSKRDRSSNIYRGPWYRLHFCQTFGAFRGF